MISRIRQRSVDALGIWRTPVLYGAATAVVFWCVWYFTKIPCTPHNAAAGLCNPAWFARFINVEILALAVGAGIAIGGVKGGYDYYMLKNMINQEREDRLKKEQELRDLISELRDELREARSNAEAYRQRLDEERRQAEAEERRLAAEDRARSIAIQQAMLEAIMQLAQNRNGNRASD